MLEDKNFQINQTLFFSISISNILKTRRNHPVLAIKILNIIKTRKHKSKLHIPLIESNENEKCSIVSLRVCVKKPWTRNYKQQTDTRTNLRIRVDNFEIIVWTSIYTRPKKPASQFVLWIITRTPPTARIALCRGVVFGIVIVSGRFDTEAIVELSWECVVRLSFYPYFRRVIYVRTYVGTTGRTVIIRTIGLTSMQTERSCNSSYLLIVLVDDMYKTMGKIKRGSCDNTSTRPQRFFLVPSEQTSGYRIFK